MNDTKLKIGLIAGILLVLLLGYGIFTLSSRAGKIAVNVTLYPSDIHATLDDKELRTGTMYLESGTYTLKGSKPGFEDLTKPVTINETQKTIVVAPTAVSPEAKEWAKKNYYKIQGLQETRAAEIGRDFNERNPIAKHLPYKTFFYSVGYRMDQSDPTGNSIILEIDASEGYRQSALYRIRQLGYDPTDFTINFRDYENPFPL
jgi:hypothetical protein